MSPLRLVAVAALVALVTASAAVVPRPAAASIVLAMDLPALVKQADHIAVVDVVSTAADWDAKHERIYSTIDLKVVERWKGAPTAGGEDHLRVIQPGGTVGDLTMTVTGLSAFTPGERTLVFLRGSATNARVLGLSQGKRPMRFETTSGKWMVQAANLHQATLVKPRVATPAPVTPNPGTGKAAPTPVVPVSATAAAADRALEEMRSDVKALLGTSAP